MHSTKSTNVPLSAVCQAKQPQVACGLHEEAGGDGLPNVLIVIRRLEVRRDERQSMLGHQTLQLLPDILGLLEGSDLEKVVVCPPADSQRHVSISEVQMRGCRSMMLTTISRHFRVVPVTNF